LNSKTDELQLKQLDAHTITSTDACNTPKGNSAGKRRISRSATIIVLCHTEQNGLEITKATIMVIRNLAGRHSQMDNS
jgi:hypothetical protein